MYKISRRVIVLVACLMSYTMVYAAVDPLAEMSTQAVVKPTQEAILSSQMPGKIIDIPVKEGEAFQKGDVLLRFDCDIHQLDLKKSTAMLRLKKENLASNQRLKDLQSVSQLAYKQSQSEHDMSIADTQAKKKHVDYCTIRAPFSGEVHHTFVKEHETVQAGQKLIDIVNPHEIIIEMLVPSSWLHWLHVGSKFVFTPSENNQTYPIVITTILPKVDSISRRIRVKGKPISMTSNLLPGMSGSALPLKHSNITVNHQDKPNKTNDI